jgi:O-antigen ligase
LAGLIFIRPFVSGLAYPVFEFWYEIAVISTAITTIRHRVSPSSYAKASEDRLATHGVGLVILVLAYIISTPTSINIHNSLKEVMKFLSYVSVFFIASNMDENRKKVVIKTIVISGLIISAYSIYQYFWGFQHTIEYLKKIDPDFLSRSSYGKDILLSKRAIGTFPSPNILGSYLVMMFFLFLHYHIRHRESPACPPKPWHRRKATHGVGLVMFMLIIALILTKSLGAWLSLIVTLIILAALSYNNVKKYKIYVIASIVIITLILVFIIINRWERLTDLENPQNSITQRLNYWRTAIAVIKDHPLAGVGPGNFQEVFLRYKVGLTTDTRYAHNILLQQWSETGILGFIGMILLLFSFIKKYRTESRYIFLAGLVFLIHNLIDNSYYIPETGLLWWAIYGIIIYGDKNV